MLQFLKIIFHISIFFLVILSLYPGNLIGFFFYGDLGYEPILIENQFGNSINHFLLYFCVALLGFYLYSKEKYLKKVIYGLFFLSLMLEFLQFIVPLRAFELADLIANFFGVLIAYLVIKIYLLFIRK